jgi:hypothetical protein
MAGAKRRPGRILLAFPLFGFDWQVRTVPTGHKILKGDGGPPGVGICYLSEHVIYLSEANTDEQARTTLAHEIQHVIEDHADVDYTQPTDEPTADRMTDQVSRGWLMLIRTCPALLAWLCGK